MNYESISLWVAVASLIVAITALFVAIGANRIAKSSLSQAKQVADRDQRDWRQRKWFDLYFKTNQAYDFLERFQVLYENPPSGASGVEEARRDWNSLMFLIRELHTMAVVFPKNAAIDELFASTAVFKNREEALSKDRLEKIRNAMEAIRQHALVEPAVLG